MLRRPRTRSKKTRKMRTRATDDHDHLKKKEEIQKMISDVDVSWHHKDGLWLKQKNRNKIGPSKKWGYNMI